MSFTGYAISLLRQNRKFIRRQKAFEYWGNVESHENNKPTSLLSPEQQRAFNKRMARAKRKGILHEIKMYIVALAIVVACYAVFQLL